MFPNGMNTLFIRRQKNINSFTHFFMQSYSSIQTLLLPAVFQNRRKVFFLKTIWAFRKTGIVVPVKFRFVSGVFRLQTSDAPAFPGSLRILPGKIRAAGMYIHASFPKSAKSFLFENNLGISENRGVPRQLNQAFFSVFFSFFTGSGWLTISSARSMAASMFRQMFFRPTFLTKPAFSIT